VSLARGILVASYLQSASTSLQRFTLQGKPLGVIELPGIGSADITTAQDRTEAFISFSSYSRAPAIRRVDLATGEQQIWDQLDVPGYRPSELTVTQKWYPSADGTNISMFLVHKKNLVLDGNNPTLLYGYGGFNIPMTPRFRATRLPFLEAGGVYAVANLRGGGEYGEAWHKAGTKTQKQNVFDDFIAAAEWLTDAGYTSPDKLAIRGGSNGGLLVGAVLTQRPDLFGVALPAVGVMDMLRYHQFTAGRFWVDDYGSADDPEMFPYLLGYSPYHNIKAGVAYPATLVTTADTDDRVVPGHSFKFAAELQYNQKGDAPVLIRIETSAGHGAGLPTSKRIEELADTWALLVKSLGMTLD